MDAKELTVVVVGLVGTFFLPWPLSELGEQERAAAHAAAEGAPALRVESAPGGNARVPAALCAKP
jgi:hypothetical protein